MNFFARKRFAVRCAVRLDSRQLVERAIGKQGQVRAAQLEPAPPTTRPWGGVIPGARRFYSACNVFTGSTRTAFNAGIRHARIAAVIVATIAPDIGTVNSQARFVSFNRRRRECESHNLEAQRLFVTTAPTPASARILLKAAT